MIFLYHIILEIFLQFSLCNLVFFIYCISNFLVYIYLSHNHIFVKKNISWYVIIKSHISKIYNFKKILQEELKLYNYNI